MGLGNADVGAAQARQHARGRRPADVAISSVSRVLSAILTSAPRCGPGPRRVADSITRASWPRACVAGPDPLVGYVVGDIANPVIADPSARGGLRPAGYTMLLRSNPERPEVDAAHIRLLLSRRVDGMILSSASDRAQRPSRRSPRCDVPVVLIDRDLPVELSRQHGPQRPSQRDAERGRPPPRLGHRRIALITGGLDLWPVRSGWPGGRRPSRRAGSRTRRSASSDRSRPSTARASTEQLLTMVPRPRGDHRRRQPGLAGCVRALVRHGSADPPGRLARDLRRGRPVGAPRAPDRVDLARHPPSWGGSRPSCCSSGWQGRAGPRTVLLPTPIQPRPQAWAPSPGRLIPGRPAGPACRAW